MADDWDLPDDGEIDSDPDDITQKPTVLPLFKIKQLKRQSSRTEKSEKRPSEKRQKPPAPHLWSFNCTYPPDQWEMLEIQPTVGKVPQDVRYELVREGQYFKLQVVVGIDVQCDWLCIEKSPHTFEAMSYECERIIYGSTFFNPFTGTVEDGIFGPMVYGDIIFGHDWKFVRPLFIQHVQMV
tara:strand:- start:5461 stop:6006 length:546 start_codon:yes stop_codon:yes gene_type:complete